MSAPQTSQPASDPVASGYPAYAQLARMLLPSSGSLAVYTVDGNLSWCSNGLERPDFRELLDAFRAAEATAEANVGQIRQASGGLRALVAKLCDEAGLPLGYVLIELGQAHSGTGNSMAASLTRPLLGCLANQLAQSRAVAAPARPSPGARSDDRRLRLLLNICSVDPSRQTAVSDLLERCVNQLGCMSAVFCLPDQALTELAYAGDLVDSDIRARFEASSKHLIAWVQLNNRPMVVNGIDKARAPFKILSCPVIGADGRSCGLFALFRSAERPNFELDDVVLIEILSRQAMTLAGGRQDALTGLLTGAAFERQIDRRLAGGTESCGGALLYVDICDLGAINAAFGFAAGDEVIRRTAQLIRSSLAGDESACRLSGDRFVLHLPDADADTAIVRGAELAAAAAKLEYVDAVQRIPVTLRYGVAVAPEGAATGRHWIAAAERASRQSL